MGLKRPLNEEAAESSNSAARSTKQSNISFSQPSNSDSTQVTNSPPGSDISPPLSSSSSYHPSSVSERSLANGSGPAQTFSASRYGGVRTYHIDRPTATKETAFDVIGNSPYGKLVLINCVEDCETPTQIIQKSTTGCHIPCVYAYENLPAGKVCCKLYVNGKLVTTGTEFSNKSAREAAAGAGLKKLQETCYTLKIKVKFLTDGTTIDKSLENTGVGGCAGGRGGGPTPNSTDTPLADDNIGNKLMRMMGWSGGGLGKDQQGIQEPVTVSQQVNRAGLGICKSQADTRTFNDKIRRLLQEYAAKDSQHDLVFSSDFSKEERKKMHEIATRLNLKTRSYGKGPDRHLVVSQKMSVMRIVEQMIRSGGSSEKYELIKPTNPVTS